jgi:hypothetical protein
MVIELSPGPERENARLASVSAYLFLDLSDVAGRFLHPCQRWDLGCSAEQHIRIIIMPQQLRRSVRLNGSAVNEYTLMRFVLLKRKWISVSLVHG